MAQIIPIFLPNHGCPHRCIFCNERIAAGDFPDRITAEIVRDTVLRHLASGNAGHRKKDELQIAFYGGNFCGIDPACQMALLETAQGYVESGSVDSIRISTRPDSIDNGALELLKKFSVKTVEIGAQSMVAGVLTSCGRGHTAGETRRAVKKLKENGFETGIHLMAGLPGDSLEGFMFSVEETAALKPDMVRLHPTIVFRDTELASLYFAGRYRPLDLETAVLFCRRALQRLRRDRINVIRIGLQATPEMEEAGAIVAGPFHPAFRSLVEGSIFLEMAESMLGTGRNQSGESFAFIVSERDLSDFRGIGNRNITVLNNRYGPGVSVRTGAGLDRGTVVLETGGKRHHSIRSEFEMTKRETECSNRVL